MQKVNKKFIGVSFALTIALLVSAVVGFSQQGKQDGGNMDRGERHGRKHGRGHDGFGRFARNLNLTDAQKAQLQQIADRHRESTRGLHEQMRGLHRNSPKADDGSFNEAAVRQAAQARANLMVELEVARARMMSEMFAVLTPEQKAQLAQQREAHKQRRLQRQNQRGGEGQEVQQ